ncbi:MAG: hypothetical protein MRQ07_01375 [Candidatus Midichloria sp.]|nr:hypothetical protein [Candidatus Midichloria sp.]
MTGEEADFLIVNDPLTPMQALSNSFRNVLTLGLNKPLLQRLNDQKKEAIIVVMQRLHVKDLTGFLLEKDLRNWQLLSLPLIAERDEVATSSQFLL